jgi:hypothetical protein
MRRLDFQERLLALGIVLCVAIVIAGARAMPPDPRGFGTHEWLGLQPCRTLQWFGVPCPFCGMTTSFSLIAHGQLIKSFTCQPAGMLLFLAMICVGITAAIAAATGRAPVFKPGRKLSLVIVTIGGAILTLAWIYKIAVCRNWM